MCTPHAHHIGQALVALQFLLIGVLALAANRPGNFNIHPAPRSGGQLVQHGPYRWIRHPMYSAVPALKAGFEERWMLAVHPGYAAYCARSWRFIPGLY